jgi:hypothetical protein
MPRLNALTSRILTGKGRNFVFKKTFSANTQNYNLRSDIITSGWNGTAPVIAELTVSGGVVIGSSSPGTVNSTTQNIVLLTRNYSLDCRNLPTGSIVVIINNGYIVGAGGQGGGNGVEGNEAEGFPGGDAIIVNTPTVVYNYGIIGGGGGGGAGGDGNGTNWPNGGGGAGNSPGPAGVGGRGGTTPQPGTLLTGGVGRFGATGGALGQAGTNYGVGGKGGPPGNAIVGISNVTYAVQGDIRGPTI